ncbi:MAG: GNAT family N-acetyltransferase [Chloroflexi bacterium]|nr:GNAT family N-acetyltransferase [Chloroflexota bacterium]
MTTNDDLSRTLTRMAEARTALATAIEALDADAMRRARPGGWTLGRVLQHVIESEATYSKLLAHQCGRAAPELATREPPDGAGAITQLEATRSAVLGLVDGIDDVALYRLTRFGHEEYSPLSVLENVAAHDRDHLDQILDVARGSQMQPGARATPEGLTVRPAAIDDLVRMTEIYNHYIVNTPTTFDLEPYTVDQRAEWFSHYAAAGRHRLLVAERDGVVVGYTSSSKFHPRAAYDTTVELTVLCAPEAIGLGIGQQLYEALFDALAGEDIHSAVALITLPNKGSCAIHERFGFRPMGVLREAGRKFGRYWDVAYYQKLMQDG